MAENENNKKMMENKKSIIWFITKQILGFIITIIVAPILHFEVSLFSGFVLGGSEISGTVTWLVILALLFMSTQKNYGVLLAFIIIVLDYFDLLPYISFFSYKSFPYRW